MLCELFYFFFKRLVGNIHYSGFTQDCLKHTHWKLCLTYTWRHHFKRSHFKNKCEKIRFENHFINSFFLTLLIVCFKQSSNFSSGGPIKFFFFKPVFNFVAFVSPVIWNKNKYWVPNWLSNSNNLADLEIKQILRPLN